MTQRARLPWALFAVHAGIIAFSTAAMLTVLNGTSVVDTTTEPAATIMRVSFRFAGPTYVVLGALTALAFLGVTAGWRKALSTGLVASALALGAELLGTSSGLPFGDYAYSGLLGYRVLGLVPFPIPLSWFYMLVCCLAIVARLQVRRSAWAWSFGAGLLMVAWDLAMDPAMVTTGHWLWGSGAQFRAAGVPGWVTWLFTADVFYGMPLSNAIGWLLTATVIARVILLILSPDTIRRTMAPSSLPIALYLANGIMPVALCFRDGLWWAGALGAVAMMVPASLAWRGAGASPAGVLSPSST